MPRNIHGAGCTDHLKRFILIASIYSDLIVSMPLTIDETEEVVTDCSDAFFSFLSYSACGATMRLADGRLLMRTEDAPGLPSYANYPGW